MVNKKLVKEKLKKVLDPELGINIVDLGLIYNIEVKNKIVAILMTLTFPGCPLGATIQEDVHEALKDLKDVEVKLEITFNPPWDLSKINPEVKAEMGILN